MDFDKLIEDLNGIRFPSIVNVQIDYNISCGVDASIYCLGVCDSFKTATTRVKEMKSLLGDTSEIYYYDVNETPVDGVGVAGGAWYRE